MGNAIVLNKPQLAEFKYQLRVLYFRLKSHGVPEADHHTYIYEFYGFPTVDKTFKPKIVLSLTGAGNHLKIESKDVLTAKITELYTSEGLSEPDIELRLSHLYNFFYTIGDFPKSTKGSPVASKDDSFRSDSNEVGEGIVVSSSYEESAEEAYERKQYEQRQKALKSKVVAVEVVAYLQRGLNKPRPPSGSTTTPDSRRASRSSLSPPEAFKSPTTTTTKTPSPGLLPAIATPKTSDSAKTKSPIKKSQSTEHVNLLKKAVFERRFSTGNALPMLEHGVDSTSPIKTSFSCLLCGNIFSSNADLAAHLETVAEHRNTVETFQTQLFEFCDSSAPVAKAEDTENLPFKFMVTRRRLFNESHEAYKVDFYLHMAQNCVEAALQLIGKDKRPPIVFYFDNSKLNGILHRIHGPMRNSKIHHDTLSSFVIDRLQQDKKYGHISFVVAPKDPKDVSSVLIQKPASMMSAVIKVGAEAPSAV